MNLRLLLDAHVAPAVAKGLARRCAGLQVLPLRDWRGGMFLDVADADLLEAAAQEGLTLVTYDLKTIPPLLRRWAEEGRHHAGVVLVDDATIPQRAVGRLVTALAQLAEAHGREDWTDRTLFLQRPKR